MMEGSDVMKHIMIGILGMTIPCVAAVADAKMELKTENDKVNYSVGYQIGGDFKRQGIDINSPALVKGIQDALKNAKPVMSEQEMRTTLINLKKKIVVKEQKKKKRLSEQYRSEGKAFLANNAKKDGIRILPSGLQYRILKQGSGKTPTADDSVTVHYRGTLVDGREFDSSLRKKKPVTFAVKGVIPGWTEALQIMKEGAKWELFIPPDLSYGARGPLADRTLIFEIDLITVNPNKADS